MHRFQSEQAVLVVASKQKQLLVIYIQHNKTVFFETTGINMAVIHGKTSLMDEEQAVFEQIILSDLKIWSSIALKTFNNFSIIIANISNKIGISCVWLLFSLLLIFE